VNFTARDKGNAAHPSCNFRDDINGQDFFSRDVRLDGSLASCVIHTFRKFYYIFKKVCSHNL